MIHEENTSRLGRRDAASRESTPATRHETRRALLKDGLATVPFGPAVSLLVRAAEPATAKRNAALAAWSIGGWGQRKADLGDGTFLNPVLPGDRPDPTILTDGGD